MPINDRDHKLAERIRDLEQRVSDAEQTSRSTETPRILISASDTVGADDSVRSVESIDLSASAGTWGNKGWKTTTWGAYGGR